MAELADALDLGSSEATRAGSIPVIPTEKETLVSFFITFLICAQKSLHC